MRLLTCFILIVALGSFVFAGEPQAPIPLPEDSVKIEQAKIAIRQIWQQAQIYYQDRGNWPDSVEELEKLIYIKFDSTIKADWLFTMFRRIRRGELAHNSVILRRMQNTVSMPDYHRVYLDTETGLWHGSGVPSYRFGSLSKEQESDLALDAQSHVLALVKAADVFYQDRGAGPSVVALVKSHYIEMPHYIKANWDIRMYEYPIDSVVAISTQWMPDGEGKRFVYYPDTKTWAGYGIVDPYFEPMIMVPYIEAAVPVGKKEIGQ